MLNQIVIAGRLVSDPEITKCENNLKRTYVTIAVPRSYKNTQGIYETDFIRCTLWNGVAESTCEYCKKGDIVGIKGRIQLVIAVGYPAENYPLRKKIRKNLSEIVDWQ